MTEFRRITDRFSAAPHLEREDFARAAAAGFRTVVANRPDSEEAGGLPTIAEARAAAEAAGLAFVAIPFAGPPSAEVVAQMEAALAGSPGPVLAYCRTGTRSTTAWAMATARAGTMTPTDIVAAAARGGYDLAALAPALERLRTGG